MDNKTLLLIGAPLDCGKARKGCLMGPDAYRVAGLQQSLSELGHLVQDLGNLTPEMGANKGEAQQQQLAECVGWSKALSRAASAHAPDGLPIFLGGDHALALGSVHGMAAYAHKLKRPLFVLWLDAHSDFHTPKTSQSGNIHGMPVAYFTGQPGFEAFAPVPHPVPPARVAMIGLRSVDPAERRALAAHEFSLTDMRAMDEFGIGRPLRDFLDKVKAANGLLHVSLDVDFLDPEIAPAVGTTVPGGATMREAHLAMEMLCDSDLVSSLDLVELNPFLDIRGRTAALMVDLIASLFGRRIFDRPTRSFA